MKDTDSLPGNCRLITLPKFVDERGNLTFLEAEDAFPFPIRRLFWIYGVPDGKMRGGHAHQKNTQFIIPVSGSFKIWLDDGKERTLVTMDQANVGVLIPPKVWSELVDFHSDSVVLVVAALPYMPEGYINDYQDYLNCVL